MSDSWNDAEAAVMGYPENHPFHVTTRFLSALPDAKDMRPVLSEMVTPESLPAWGDFSLAAEIREGWGDWFLGTRTAVAPPDLDVAYARIFKTVDAPAIAVITLVWRSERDTWLIHGLGPEPWLPDDGSRTSPGVAPSVDLWMSD